MFNRSDIIMPLSYIAADHMALCVSSKRAREVRVVHIKLAINNRNPDVPPGESAIATLWSGFGKPKSIGRFLGSAATRGVGNIGNRVCWKIPYRIRNLSKLSFDDRAGPSTTAPTTATAGGKGDRRDRQQDRGQHRRQDRHRQSRPTPRAARAAPILIPVHSRQGSPGSG